MHILALNCGSSSIKGRLYAIPSSRDKDLEQVAKLAVSNIGSVGDKVTVKIAWDGREEATEVEAGDGGEAAHKDMFPVLLDELSKGGISPKEIKYITHRIVHGGTNKEPLVVTRDHPEALEGMDALSAFAPLHNHHAILGVRACLDVLPEHTGLLLFDTLFHQTLPREVYSYALPPPTEELPMPLRKYGFHGLSYASILDTLSKHEKRPKSEMNLVVAHLGSGASACCILHGESVDTSMGLTPLEGLVGGTRAGTIDPTAIFHHSSDYAADAGVANMRVTKAEWLLNKKSGLTALAGTQNFSLITQRMADEKDDKHESAKLAYNVFLDRLMAYVSQYLCKLLASVPLSEIRLVFAGGIGEHSPKLRADVLGKLGWLGVQIAENNDTATGTVREISKGALKAYVVETDEEGWCAQLAREQFGF